MNDELASEISPIAEIIEDFRKGKMVILVDDEDRENEGDLVIAADDISPQAINFMASQARGLICLTLTQEHCQRLNLPLMTHRNNARYSTNFTVSIEAAEGVTTGISAADRATTIKAAANPNADAKDIAMPGHIFPVMAQPGGVLTRAGHTEAGVDLARLSGKTPSSVICEVLNGDGTMARLTDLIDYSKLHNIKIGTIADLIRYRLKNEPTVIRIAQQIVNSKFGEINIVAYHDTIENHVHYALILGDIQTQIEQNNAVNVRVQVSTPLEEILLRLDHSDNDYINKVCAYMKQHNHGVLVLIHYADTAQDVIARFNQTCAADSTESEEDLRILGLGSQILADLDIHKMNVLGTKRKMHALSGFGLQINNFIETF